MSGTQTVVREVISDMAPAGPVGLTSDSKLIADLGFDSLGLVELIVVLEDTLSLSPLDEGVLAGIASVGDLERVAREAQAQAQVDP